MPEEPPLLVLPVLLLQPAMVTTVNMAKTAMSMVFILFTFRYLQILIFSIITVNFIKIPKEREAV